MSISLDVNPFPIPPQNKARPDVAAFPAIDDAVDKAIQLPNATIEEVEDIQPAPIDDSIKTRVDPCLIAEALRGFSPSSVSPFSLDPLHELNLILGDSYMDGTPYKGGDSKSVFAALISFIDSIAEDCPDFILDKESIQILKQLEKVFRQANDHRFSLSIHLERIPTQLPILIQSIRDQLNAEGICLLDGGWSDQDGGHAICYEIVTQSNGKYTFRCYNRGAGSEFHETPAYDGQLYIPAFFELCDITEERMFNDAFWRGIVELKGHGSTIRNSDQVGQNDLYLAILPLLRGTKTAINVEMESLMSVQYSGTCTWKSVTGILRKNLSYRQFKTVKLRFEQFMFWSYTAAYCSCQGEEEATYNKALAALVHATRNAYAQGIIGKEEHDRQVGLMESLQRTLDENKKRVQDRILAEHPSMPVDPSEMDPSCPILDCKTLSTVNHAAHSSANSGQTATYPLQFAWTPLIAEYAYNQAVYMHHYLEAAEKTEDHDTAVQSVQSFIRSLPLPALEKNPDNLWQQYLHQTKGDPTKLYVVLTDILEEYIFHLQYTLEAQSLLLDPLIIVDVYRLYCILDNLLVHADPDKTRLFGINTLHDYRMLSQLLGKPLQCTGRNEVVSQYQFERNLTFQIKNPEQARIMEEIYAYLEQRRITTQSGTTQRFAFDFVPRHSQDYHSFFEASSYMKSDDINFKKPINPEFEFFIRLFSDANSMKVFLDGRVPMQGKVIEQIKEYMNRDEEHLIRFSPIFNKWLRLRAMTMFLLTRVLFPSIHEKTQNKNLRFPDYNLIVKSYDKILEFKLRCFSWGSVWDSEQSLPQEQKDRLEAIEKRAANKMYDNMVAGYERKLPPEFLFDLNHRTVSDVTIRHVLDQTRRFDTKENYIWLDEKDSELSRNLKLIACNAELRIDRLLTFYHKHGIYLKEKDHQLFFNFLFSEATLLRDSLILRPELYTAIHAFIKKGLEQALAISDFALFAFYLRLAKQTDEVAYHIKNSLHHEGWKQHAIGFNGRKKILKALKSPDISIEERSLLYGLYIECALTTVWKTHKDHLSVCATALGTLNLYPIPGQYDEPQHLLDRIQATKQLAPQLMVLAQADPEYFSSQLVQCDDFISASIKNQTWETHYPLIKTKDNSFSFNLYTGDLFFQSFKRVVIPSSLLAKLPDDLYVPGVPLYMLEKNHLMFYDKSGHKIELIANHTHTKINEILRTTPEGDVFLLMKAPLSIPIPQTGLIQWHHKDRNEVWVCEGVNHHHRILYKVHLNELQGEKNTVYECKVERLPRSPKEEPLFLHTPKKDNCVKGGECLFFCDKTGKPKRLEFPRMGLEFVLIRDGENRDRWSCLQRSGFYLDHVQYLDLLESIHINQYLLLENEKHDKEIFIPHESSYRRIPFQMDPAKMHHVLTPTGEDAVFFALKALQTKSLEGYEIAWDCLRPEIAVPLHPSPEFKDMLLSMLAESNQDNDIRAVACRLRAALYYLISEEQENSTAIESSDPKLIRNVVADLKNYARKQKRAGAYHFVEQDELKLLCLCFNACRNSEGQADLGFTYSLVDRARELHQKHPDTDTPNYPSLSLETRIEYNKTIKKPIVYISAYNGMEAYLLDFLKDPPPAISYTRPDPHHNEYYLLNLLPGALIADEKDPRKKRVRDILDLSMMSTNSDLPFYKTVLKEICDHPKKYAGLLKAPPEVSIEEYAKKLEELIFKPSRSLPNDQRANTIETEVYSVRAIDKKGTRNRRKVFSSLMGTRGTRFLQQAQNAILENADEIADTIRLEDFSCSNKTILDYRLHDYTRARLESLFERQKNAKGLRAQENERMIADIRAYDSQQKGIKPPEFTLDDRKIDEMIGTLEAIIAYRRAEGCRQIDTLMRTVNQGEYYPGQRELFISGRLSHSHPTYTFNDLLLIHGRQEHALITGDNAESEDDLFDEIVACLDYQQETQRYRRVLQLLQDYKATTDEATRERLRAKAYDTLINHSHYDRYAEPEKQIIEYVYNLSLREEQLGALSELIQTGRKSGIVHQARPGFGKTTLVIPLYLLLKADGKRPSLCIVPDHMLQWIGEELRSRIGGNFGTWLRLFNMEAGKSYSSRDCKKFYDRLQEITANKQVLILGVKAAHSFIIQNDRAIKQYCGATVHTREELQNKLDWLLETRELFEEASVLGDEGDIWLNTRREVNVACGEERRLKDEEQLALVCLYDALLTTPEIADAVAFNFESNPNHDKQPYTHKIYEDLIKPALVDAILAALGKAPIWESERAQQLYDFYIQLSDKEKVYIRILLLKDRQHLDYAEASRWLDQLTDRAMSNFLHLIAEEVETLLLSTLQRKSDEGYGLYNNLAIPARNGTLLEGSEFGNAHETANYTIQSMVKHGIPTQYIQLRVQKLQNECMKELKLCNSLQESESYQAFLSMCPGNAKRRFFNCTKATIQEMTDEVNASQQLRKTFLILYILNQIKLYSARYNSNAFRLVRLFPHMRAVTGTLPKHYAYSELLDIKTAEGTDSRTLFTLYRHCLQQKDGAIIRKDPVMECSGETPRALLDAVCSCVHQGNKTRLITDLGGFLNGSDIEMFAEQLLGLTAKQGIQAICHHNKGKPILFVSKKESVIPLKASAIQPTDRFTVLQQPYTTGTDIAQDPHAQSIVTISKNTTLPGLIQACWRARQIHEGQTVCYLMSKDTAQVIRNTLSLPADQAITLDEIFQFAHENILREWEKDNEMGTGLAILEYVQNLIYQGLKHCKKQGILYENVLTPEAVSLLEQEQPCEARLMYNGESYVDAAENVLKKDAMRVYQRFESIWKQSIVLQQLFTLEGVKAHLLQLVCPQILPEEITARKNTSSAMFQQEVEVTREQEKELEEENEVEKERVSETETLDRGEWLRYDWKPLPPHKEETYAFSLTSHAWGIIYQAGAFVSERVMELPSTHMTRSVWRVLNSMKERVHIPPQIKRQLIRGATLAFNKLIGQHAFLYPLSEYIEAGKYHSAFADVWDRRLLVSSNFAPSLRKNLTPLIIEPFDKIQKISPYVILRKNVESHEWTCAMIDQTDAAHFLNSFSSYRGYPVDKGVETCLYGLDNDTLIPGPGSLTMESIQLDSTACQLIAQAKFYNGIVTYTPSETKALQEWITQCGKEKMRDLFCDLIVRYRSDRHQLINAFEKLLTKVV